MTITLTGTGIAPVYNAAFVSQEVVSAIVAGGDFTVSVTMQNTGNVSWGENHPVQLGSQNSQDNLVCGLNRTSVDLSTQRIDPGQQLTFSFTVTSPDIAGYYHFQWRMVQDGGVGWFGALSPDVKIHILNPPKPRSNTV
jgi:hypothetical protein